MLEYYGPGILRVKRLAIGHPDFEWEGTLVQYRKFLFSLRGFEE